VTGGSLLLSDGQVHHDTHAVPMGNYVTPGLGNYVLTSAPWLGNYVIADTRANFATWLDAVGISRMIDDEPPPALPRTVIDRRPVNCVCP
jgi:hypothetical protein